MFLFTADSTCFTSPETEEKKPDGAKSEENLGKDGKKKTSLKHHESVSESEEYDNNSEARKDGEDSDSGNQSPKCLKTQSSTSTLLPWITTKSSESTSSLSFIRKSATSSSAAQVLPRFTSGTSIAKKQAAESKRKARASHQHLSSEEEDPEDALSSEFEDSDEELNAKGGTTDIKTEIVTFFQTASVDEMSLISGCSVKKAQKILELRPFDSWRSLVR